MLPFYILPRGQSGGKNGWEQEYKCIRRGKGKQRRKKSKGECILARARLESVPLFLARLLSVPLPYFVLRSTLFQSGTPRSAHARAPRKLGAFFLELVKAKVERRPLCQFGKSFFFQKRGTRKKILFSISLRKCGKGQVLFFASCTSS